MLAIYRCVLRCVAVCCSVFVVWWRRLSGESARDAQVSASAVAP